MNRFAALIVAAVLAAVTTPLSAAYPITSLINADEYVAFTADAHGENDIGHFSIQIRIQAADGALFLWKNGITGTIWDANDLKMASLHSSQITMSGSSAGDLADWYVIPANTHRDLTATIEFEPWKPGYVFARFELNGFQWHSAPNPDVPFSYYQFDGEYRTEYLGLYASVPEPASLSLIATACLSLTARRRK